MLKTTISKIVASDKCYLYSVIFTLLAANTFVFIIINASPFVKADVWRHLNQILIPLLEGRADWLTLWTNHHPSPLLHLLQLLNIKLSDFRQDIDGYAGFLFLFLSSAVISKRIFETLNQSNNQWLAFITSVLAILILFGFNSINQYTWPLVTTVQYLYFFAIISFLCVDYYSTEQKKPIYLALGSSTVLFLLFANADYGSILTAASISACAISYIFSKDKRYLHILTLFTVMIIFYRVVIAYMDSTPYGASESINVIDKIISYPMELLTTFSTGLTSGFFNVTLAKEKIPEHTWLIEYLSYAVLTAYTLLSILFIKHKLWNVTLFPLALMLVSAIFSLGVIAFRINPEVDTIWALAAPRYVPTHKLSAIGMIWTGSLLINHYKSHYDIKKALPIGTLFITAFIAIQLIQIVDGWRTSKYIIDHNNKAALAIFLASHTDDNNIKLPSEIVGGNKNYMQSLDYLRKNKLNVFSEKYPKGKKLKEHIESMRQYTNSESILFQLIPSKNESFSNTFTSPEFSVTSYQNNSIEIKNISGGNYIFRITSSAPTKIHNGLTISTTTNNSSADTETNTTYDFYNGTQVLYLQVQEGCSYLLEFKNIIDLKLIEAKAPTV